MTHRSLSQIVQLEHKIYLAALTFRTLGTYFLLCIKELVISRNMFVLGDS